MWGVNFAHCIISSALERSANSRSLDFEWYVILIPYRYMSWEAGYLELGRTSFSAVPFDLSYDSSRVIRSHIVPAGWSND